jgi:hypothetical protein
MTQAAAEGSAKKVSVTVVGEEADEAPEAEQSQAQEAEGEPEAEATEATAEAAETPDQVLVTIGEESPPSDEDEGRAPEWVRELRKQHRQLAQENRELRAKLDQTQPAPQATVVGDEPTLEGCDFDPDKFKADWTAWNSRKAKAEQEAKEREQAESEAQAAWQAKLQGYQQAKAGLKVQDFDDAEEHVRATLNVTQQGVILQGAERPELVVYALGKNPNKAKELASIKDPVKFAFAVAKLETQLKVTPRKQAPLPEKKLPSGGPISGTVDSTLERLRAEAERTGDYTKVFAYRQQQRTKRAA